MHPIEGEVMYSKKSSGATGFGRRATAAGVVTGLLAVSHTVVAGAGTGNATESDVMAWLRDVSPAITVDQSNECVAGALDEVAYRNDRIVLRTSMANGAAASAVNSALNTMYATTGAPYVGPVERITLPYPPPPSTPVTPVLSVTLKPRPGGAAHQIVRLARTLRERQIPASPDYALTPSGPYNFFWPNGYPERISALTPPRVDGAQPIGDGVKIEILDTGLAPTAPNELPNTSTLSNGDAELINIVANGPSMADYPHVAHGKAIAGVISTIAPGTLIEQVRISDRDGLATDVSAVRNTARSLTTLSRADYPDLIVNAFGTPACDLTAGVTGPDLRPIGLEAVAEAVDKFDAHQDDGMLIVASAGNMATDRPHYPAAFDTVLGVGALDATLDGDGSPWSAPARTAPVATFSNYGAWVDAWAPGVDLPTTHANGVRFEYGGDIIQGKAEVDGTSFAAPLVAGLIAEQMGSSGRDARSSWVDIAATGVAPLPPCSSNRHEQGVAVALAALTESATGQPIGATEPC